MKFQAANLKAIVLDFDNCIVLDEKTARGSEEVKDAAWFTVFPEYGRTILEPVLKDVNQRIAGGQGDRYDLIRMVCEHFGVPSEQIPNEVERRSQLFNKLVQEGIRKIGVSEKVRQTLQALSQRRPLYINSATPKILVMESLEALAISPFFKDVYGTPGTKVANLQAVISKEKISPPEILFIDDQPSGWLVAQEVSCQFMGIHTARNRAWHQDGQPFYIIHSLSELLAIIE